MASAAASLGSILETGRAGWRIPSASPGRAPTSTTCGSAAPPTRCSCAPRRPRPGHPPRHLGGRAVPRRARGPHRAEPRHRLGAGLRQGPRRRSGAARWPTASCATSATRSPSSSPRPGPRRWTRPSWSTSTTRSLGVVVDPEAALADGRAPAVPRARHERRPVGAGGPPPRRGCHRRRARRRRRRRPGPDREPAPGHRPHRGQRDPGRPARPRRPRPALTAFVATQHPHMTRDLIARYTGLDKAAVRVVAPHVGGAFGGKAGIGSDHGAVVAAARALGRPVAWTETRSEAMISMHGRAAIQYAELGVTRDGKITGLRCPQHRRLRRLRRLRRHPGRRTGPHHGPGSLRHPGHRLLRRRGDDQHRPQRRLPRRRAARGGRAARAAGGPGRRRARPDAPRRCAGATCCPTTCSPTRPCTGADLRRRRLHGAPSTRRCGWPTSTRCAPSRPAASTSRRRAAARHRGLDLRRDHRLRRQGARRRPHRRRTARPRSCPAPRPTARATPRRSP